VTVTVAVVEVAKVEVTKVEEAGCVWMAGCVACVQTVDFGLWI
jgi:hypothetical protein